MIHDLLPASTILLAAGLAGIWLARRAPTGVARVTLGLLPVMVLGVAVVGVATVQLAACWEWSACRLAPALALFHSYPLYSPETSGPINGWLYGPVPALVWTPAVLAATPETALRIAATINLTFLVWPLLLAARPRGTTDPWITVAVAGPAFVAGGCALLLIYPTWYMASVLNADATAAGLGVGSCLILAAGDGPPSGRRMLGAGLLGVLAAWSKQIEAPLLIAQLLWLGLMHGRRSATAYLLWWLAAAVPVSAVFIAGFGAGPLWYNMWIIPAAHPLVGGWSGVLTEITAFLGYTAVFWIVAVIAVVAGPPGARSGLRAVLQSHRWLLLALAGVVLLPAGAAASIKLGGDRNSIHAAFYVVAMATAAGAGLAARPRWLAPGPARAALLGVALVTLGLGFRLVTDYPRRTMLPPRCLSNEAYQFARQHPGEVYFPWDPLATLLADGVLHHFEYGVRDRQAAGRPPGAAHLRAHLPVKTRIVIYPRTDSSRTMLDLCLPGYRLAADTGDWLVFTRPARP